MGTRESGESQKLRQQRGSSGRDRRNGDRFENQQSDELINEDARLLGKRFSADLLSASSRRAKSKAGAFLIRWGETIKVSVRRWGQFGLAEVVCGV